MNYKMLLMLNIGFGKIVLIVIFVGFKIKICVCLGTIEEFKCQNVQMNIDS